MKDATTERRGGAVRLDDVARHAGTTSITVSRALRQPEKVAPATRARVLEAVAELGYVPNLAASSLASRKSRLVAVIVPTIAASVFADTVQGLSDAITADGHHLMLGETGYSAEAERRVVAAFLGRQPEALAYVGVLPPGPTRELVARAGLPLVETWDLSADPVDLLVGFSNRDAGHAMTRFLVERGYRRIGFVGGADERAAARREGYRAALAESALGAPREQLVTEPLSHGAGRRALHALREAQAGLDAVFFATDVLAIGALMECRRLGLAVPGRLAIAGLGDLEIAGEVVPALTTVRVPSYEIGRRAGEMLLQRIRGETPAPRILDLGFEIVARESA